MKFINRDLTGMWKVVAIAIVALVFVQMLPFIISLGILSFIVFKSVKFLKGKMGKSVKFKHRDVNEKTTREHKKERFSHKKVIDVDYYEV
ncbi:hypothetical protein [Clostridium sp.]|jgi:hypothetical protein|uniref:hypothetical protein n=1 Tax=Clostridium sp. TaxID=1506 RepID=UPI003A5BF991